MDKMDEKLAMLEEEKLAMQVMESFDCPSDDALASLDEEKCVKACKDLMDIEMALRQEAHAVDVRGMLRAFHARRRKVIVRRLVVGLVVAASLVGFGFFLFRREESLVAQPVLVQIDYIYKADSTIYNKVETSPRISGDGKICQIVTSYGQTKTLLLPDGTEVVLNASSRLVYPATFGKGERVVKLFGEAFFKVKKDVRHPFIVKSGRINTIVLGTQFDVKNDGVTAPSVVLLEGKVMLTDSLGRNNVLMKSGQSATLNQNGDFSLEEGADMEGCLSWKDGYLYYDGISLEKMLNEIGRWYNVDVICKNPSAKNNRVHFYVPNKQSLEKTVDMINKLQVAHVTLEDGQIVVR